MSSAVPEPEYDLVMPFVVCASKGGPYDDDAFVAGWRLAVIDTVLGMPGAQWHGHVQQADLPQVELIAMRHGLICAPTADEVEGGWVEVFVA